MNPTAEHTIPPNVNATADDQKVAAIEVPEHQRLGFLPRRFGAKLIVRGEVTVYAWMGTLSSEYTGGLWRFYELSNGGFYLAPTSPARMTVSVAGNGFEGSVSADAAGIIATLFALNQLIWQGHEHLEDAYYRLVEFAGEHAESPSIRGSID